MTFLNRTIRLFILKLTSLRAIANALLQFWRLLFLGRQLRKLAWWIGLLRDALYLYRLLGITYAARPRLTSLQLFDFTPRIFAYLFIWY